MNWFKAQALMATARNKSKGKPITYNTRLWEMENGKWYSITLHGNEIVRVYPDGNVYSHAGWRTVTTKSRLNDFMPHHTVYQRDWEWYIRDHNDGWEDNPEFVDGMFICKDGAMWKSKNDYVLRPLGEFDSHGSGVIA